MTTAKTKANDHIKISKAGIKGYILGLATAGVLTADGLITNLINFVH
jgi:hypothetical protein